MTVSEKLQKVREIKEEIRTAVNEKGAGLSEEQAFDEYPQAVGNIPQSVINMLPAPEGMYSISLGTNDETKGSVSGVCAATEGTIVTVKATPADAGYALEGWYEEVDGEEEFQSGEREYRFDVDRDRMLLAKFTDAYMAGRDWFQALLSETDTVSAVCTLYGNGIFLSPTTLISSGKKWLRMSTDGINWHMATEITSKIASISVGFLSGAYGNGVFVFMQENHYVIAYDSIADTLTRSFSGITADIYKMSYLNGGFYGIISATSKAIYRATDPFSWTSITISSTGAYHIGMAYGNGVYVVMDRSGLTWVSEDGEVWEPGNTKAIISGAVSTRYLKDLAYGNGVFIAYGICSTSCEIYISEDGITWHSPDDTSIRTGSSASQIVYGDGVFVVFGGDGFAYSTNNGATWTFSKYLNNDFLSAVAYGKGTFVGFYNQSSAKPIVYYSRSRGPALP